MIAGDPIKVAYLREVALADQTEFCGDVINPLAAVRLQPPHAVEARPVQQAARNQGGVNGGGGGLVDLIAHQGGGGGDPRVVVWAVRLSVGS